MHMGGANGTLCRTAQGKQVHIIFIDYSEYDSSSISRRERERVVASLSCEPDRDDLVEEVADPARPAGAAV